MPQSRIYKSIIIFIILFFLNVSISYAFTYNDGFGPAKKIEDKHFIVYYVPELDISVLSQQLNIRPSDKLIVGKSIERKLSSEAEFIDMLDTLFLRVCDILDMHLYSFQGNIKICQNHQQLKSIYSNLFNKELTSTHAYSFYVYDVNAIYISAENFKREILGHEIAHAVISHYFVVLPSEKIQEVLAMYVEYQLRKTGE